jgi:hypothetical protein
MNVVGRSRNVFCGAVTQVRAPFTRLALLKGEHSWTIG